MICRQIFKKRTNGIFERLSRDGPIKRVTFHLATFSDSITVDCMGDGRYTIIISIKNDNNIEYCYHYQMIMVLLFNFTDSVTIKQ